MKLASFARCVSLGTSPDTFYVVSPRHDISERLSPEDQQFVLEEVLAYHEKAAEKIGCGVEAIKVGIDSNFITVKHVKHVKRSFGE